MFSRTYRAVTGRESNFFLASDRRARGKVLPVVTVLALDGELLRAVVTQFLDHRPADRGFFAQIDFQPAAPSVGRRTPAVVSSPSTALSAS